MATDVLLDATGDLPTRTYHATGIDVIAQRLRIRLGRFLGEWILDVTKGLDYPGWTQTKEPDVSTIGARIRMEIETTPGVIRVQDWDGGTFDRAAQSLTYNGVVMTDEGELALVCYPLGTGRGNRHPALLISIIYGGTRGITP